jgi:hypothetical protein
MPIDYPRLDDLTYDRVLDDLVRRIPVYAPQWTDFNHSDPGITLLQLFSQLAEQLGYRLNRLPEKAHVELLKLLGVHLLPAHAARTRLAILLADPAKAVAFTLPSGTQAAAKTGNPPPVFSTWAAADIVPAQLGVLLTTRNPLLNDIFASGDPAPADLDPDDFPSDDNQWVSVRWDGKKPKDKDLPGQPVVLMPNRTVPHRYLWLGMQFNAAPDAGFLGTRVNLSLQFDDDEQPTRTTIEACGLRLRTGESAPVIDWLHYFDVATGTMRPLTGRIDDATAHLAKSGDLRFAIPATMGAIADAQWKPLQAASGLSPLEACLGFGTAMGDELTKIGPLTDIVADIGEDYRSRFVAKLDEHWATLPPAPAIRDLLQSYIAALRTSFSQPWPVPPPSADLANFYLTQANTFVSLLAIPGAGGLNSLVTGAFGGFINGRRGDLLAFLGGLDLTQFNPATFASQLATDLQTWINGNSWNGLLGDIHNSFLNAAQTELNAFWNTLNPPFNRIDDIIQFFINQLQPVVDALWTGPVGVAAQVSIAQYYRSAVANVITEVWSQVPTAKAAELADRYSAAIAAGRKCLTDAQAAMKPYVAHPLAPKHRGIDKVAGWIRITLPDALAAPSLTNGPKVRHIGFNVVAVEHSQTVLNEIAGSATGEPGLSVRLRNGDVLAGTLRVAIQESSDPAIALTPWNEVETLDDQDANARVFALDREAGVITFGDGIHGRVPPLVPGAGLIVAQTYRHGGGLAGEVGVGAISALKSAPAAVSAAVNLAAATGGRDAEDLAQAEVRARKELSTRSRAVTADDFVWFALQTDTVRVGHAECAPLRRPLAQPAQGLDTIVAHGAVAVVVVPDQRDVAEPLPTKSFLRAVCTYLDRFRLVTTELNVVPPQYCRLVGFQIAVMALPGYTRTQLQDAIEARLRTYLHPLTGGDDGKGSPFGGQLHIADLMALILRVEGVDRVDSLSCRFARSKTNAGPRSGQLVLCPSAPGDVERVDLAAEECASVDVSDLILTTVA